MADTGDLTIETVGDGVRDSDLTLKADGRIILEAADSKPVNIYSTAASSSTLGGVLNLQSNDGAALADDHLLGRLGFQAAENTSGTMRMGAKIDAYADATWSDTVNDTRLEFYTMDGNNQSELSLTLDSDKLATFTGAVTVTGALTGTLATEAQDNVTSLGTLTELNVDNININGDTITASADLTIIATGNDITLDSDTLTISSQQTQKPRVDLVDTTNDNDGSRLRLVKNRGGNGTAGQDNDLISALQFQSYNDAGTPELTTFAQILSNITDATDGQESGSMTFQVASHGGGNETGLVIKGGRQDDEVDVDIGLGVDSVTTVAGSLRPVGQIQMFLSSFSANDLDTKHYIAFNDGDSENTAHGNVDLPIIAPVAGKLLRVCMRSNMNNSTRTYTVRLETQALTVGPGTGPSVVGTQSGDGATNSNMVTYDFTTGLDSGDNLIDAGDMVFVSLQTDTAPSNAKHYITCVFEWNFSTI